MESFLVIVSILLGLVILLQFFLLRGYGRSAVNLNPLAARFEGIEKAQERTERVLREEIGRNREEFGRQEQAQRQELQTVLASFSAALTGEITAISTSQRNQLELLNQQTADLTRGVTDRLSAMRDTIERTLNDLRVTLEERVTRVFGEHLRNVEQIRSDLTAAAQQTRSGISDSLVSFNDSLVKTVTEFGSGQFGQLAELTLAMETKLESIRTTINGRMKVYQDEAAAKLDQIRSELSANVSGMRTEVGDGLKSFNDSVVKSVAELGNSQSAQLSRLTEITDQKLEAVRTTVHQRLQAMQEENTQKLEQIRHTVDEQLQGTLDRRLGESFQIVSDRLEQVYRGLGEMQNLASGVGDLKKLLSNVRSRGTWGEVQLGMLLEQVLAPEQYATNVATTGTRERVEFAIRLPGSEPDQNVWLPIDAKFPKEDYERLVDAVERADANAIEESSRQLEWCIRQCARDISQKYVEPPKTTDFAIMYLPTESLYAEVLRRPGLMEALQHDFRVTVAGPMTLAAILNSLQMGFRTLMIQKRSSEVWEVLGNVKTEFSRYADLLFKVQKKLQEANNSVEAGLTRTRAIQRKLKSVQELVPVPAQELIALETAEPELAEVGADR